MALLHPMTHVGTDCLIEDAYSYVRSINIDFTNANASAADVNKKGIGNAQLFTTKKNSDT